MNKQTKSFVALLLLISFASSGAALAAPSDESNAANQIQPYISATGGTGIIGFDDYSGKLQIVHDTFVATTQASQATKVVREMVVATSGYNSEVGQTDDSPFIAADGTHTYDGMVAANFLKFGTKIQIPDYFGDKVFTVHDRMNRRYTERVDVWFPEHQQAMNWGVRHVRIVILES